MPCLFLCSVLNGVQIFFSFHPLSVSLFCFSLCCILYGVQIFSSLTVSILSLIAVFLILSKFCSSHHPFSQSLFCLSCCCVLNGVQIFFSFIPFHCLKSALFFAVFQKVSYFSLSSVSLSFVFLL